MIMINAKRTSAAAALVAAAVVATMPAAAQPKLVAGTLTCKGQGTVGLILGSKQELSCTYVSAGQADVQDYSATITKVGLDLGVTGPSIMIWTVLGSSTALPYGALEGTYGGLSAEASVALGVGANALVGGSKNSVVLQPLSVKGQQGVNIAVGVASLSVRARR